MRLREMIEKLKAIDEETAGDESANPQVGIALSAAHGFINEIVGIKCGDHGEVAIDMGFETLTSKDGSYEHTLT